MNFSLLLGARMRAALALGAMAALFMAQPGSAQTCGPQVPSSYLDLCNTLTSDINAFNNTLNGLGTGSKYPVMYAGELTDANATNGPQILNSGNIIGVETQIQMLKAMGVQAIAVRVDFPMLYEPFFSGGESEYQQYVSYYTQVAQEIRAAGMKLIVENTLMLSTGDLAGWATQLAPFYATLNWTQYQAARARTAQTVTQVMQPDYLVIVEEPDSEAMYSGQPNADTPGGSVSLVDEIHASVQAAGVSGVLVGAGVGSWLPDFQSFIYGYTDQQCSSTQPCVTIPLDFIDMHIYPINNLRSPANQNFLADALSIAQIAAAAGKPVTMSECWDWKVRNDELNVLTPDQIMSRNAFSFWAQVDAFFVRAMQNFANTTQMTFMVPYNTQDFSAYLTYTASLGNMTPEQIYTAWFAQSVTNMNEASDTRAAYSYYYSLVSPPNTTPPSIPPNLAAVSGSPTMVNLTWGASTDNVGVQGYHVWRNGAQLPNTALLYLQDNGLTGNTTYTYQVAAFDLGGNVSPTSVVTVTTQNSTVPNPPANLNGVAVSGQQINLTWKAPTGSAPLTSYLVFRGSSPTNLVQIQQLSNTFTSFDNYYLTPGTTYYYGVEAEAKGLASPMSNIVEVTTLRAPSQPLNVVAAAISSTYAKVTWTASTGGLPISAYPCTGAPRPPT